MNEPRTALYQWGQRVAAVADLVNDGSHPSAPADALLVPQGGVGEIVNIGHHGEANVPVYLVDFAGCVIGCFEEELRLAGV
jgi:nitrogen fixation protein NifZ